jgi:hypothetical protein
MLAANPVIAVVGIVFFGGGGILMAVRMIRDARILLLDGDGIHLLANAGGTIPWADVEYFGISRDPAGPVGTKLIGVRLLRYDGYLASSGAGDSLASMLEWSRKRSGLDVTWSPLLFSKDAEQIVAELDDYRRRALAS